MVCELVAVLLLVAGHPKGGHTRREAVRLESILGVPASTQWTA